MNDPEEKLEKYLEDAKCTDHWTYFERQTYLEGLPKVLYFKEKIWHKLLLNERIYVYSDKTFNRRFLDSTRKWKKVCSLVYRNRALYLISPKEHIRILAEIIDKRIYLR